MNTKLKEVFRGKVVNKAHTINTGVDEFPRYVLEYLIDNYCAEETFHEDMEKVSRRLKEKLRSWCGVRQDPALHSRKPSSFRDRQPRSTARGNRGPLLGEYLCH